MLNNHSLIVNNSPYNLRESGSSKICLKFFGLVLRSSLYRRLTFPTLHALGIEASLTERLKVLAIGEQSVLGRL